MQRCKNCGSNFEGKFCPVCGYKVEERCPKCSAPVGAGVRFCTNCGQELAATTTPVMAQAEAQPAAQSTVYDEIVKNSFDKTWGKYNPKDKRIQNISRWCHWVLCALVAISITIWIVKLINIQTQDLSAITIEDYNVICVGITITVSIGLLIFLNRDIFQLLKQRSVKKWATILQNDVTKNPPLNMEGKPLFDETSFSNLTNRKLYILRIIKSIYGVICIILIGVFCFSVVNELTNIIIGEKIANHLDLPFLYEIPQLKFFIALCVFAFIDFTFDIYLMIKERPVTYTLHD